jgi:hypothetical protein
MTAKRATYRAAGRAEAGNRCVTVKLPELLTRSARNATVCCRLADMTEALATAVGFFARDEPNVAADLLATTNAPKPQESGQSRLHKTKLVRIGEYMRSDGLCSDCRHEQPGQRCERATTKIGSILGVYIS